MTAVTFTMVPKAKQRADQNDFSLATKHVPSVHKNNTNTFTWPSNMVSTNGKKERAASELIMNVGKRGLTRSQDKVRSTDTKSRAVFSSRQTYNATRGGIKLNGAIIRAKKGG